MNHITDKDNFCLTSMVMLPKFVTETVFDETKAALKKKNLDLNLEKARLFRLEKFITDFGYAVDFSGKCRHHEIYLGDTRKVAPEKLKTVIRYPVKLI